MKKSFTFFIAIAAAGLAHAADSAWVVESSLISYHAYHTFHNTLGKSEAAKGKGVCGASGCDFLVAVPVKTFDSGDQNRDLHMLQTVKGGEFPMVSVRTHTPTEPNGQFKADITVEFAGKPIVYPGVAFEVVEKGTATFEVKGTIPLVLTKHDVERPSLLGVAIKDDAPVDIDIRWKKTN